MRVGLSFVFICTNYLEVHAGVLVGFLEINGRLDVAGCVTKEKDE